MTSHPAEVLVGETTPLLDAPCRACSAPLFWTDMSAAVAGGMQPLPPLIACDTCMTTPETVELYLAQQGLL